MSDDTTTLEDRIERWLSEWHKSLPFGMVGLLTDVKAEIATLRQERDEMLRIEPLHDPACPYKPFEDAGDVPDDVVCTCSSLAARWKSRAMVEQMKRRAAEAENARLRASASALAKDWLDRSCLSLCMHDTCRCRKTLAAQLYALLAPPAETDHE